MRPHIAGFNEVTYTFFEMIKEAEWAKQEYWISDFNQTIYKKGFGNLLICRVKPISLLPMRIKTLPRDIITGFFAFTDSQGN